MGDVIAAITAFLARASALELSLTATVGCLVLVLVALLVGYLRLWKSHSAVEAELFENTIGRESTNWTNTALNLERKAKDPGIVARTSVMTHLHMLDEAATAWLKGSQWPDALRVTQELLRECCHAIIKPSIHEDDFRATSDLIKRALEKYPDLSKAANEAVDNAVDFLTARDVTLSILSESALIQDLRDRIEVAASAITRKRARAA